MVLLDKKAKVKGLSLLLKLLVFSATLYFIYIKVVKNDNFISLSEIFFHFSRKEFLLLALVVMLMPLNWLLESLKWKKLLKDIETITLVTSLKAVWAGLTINNWIPNRMAEFLGRMLFLKKENRNQSVSCTLTGGLAQFSVTIIWGVFSIFLVYSGLFSKSYLLLAVVISVFLLVFYFNLNALNFITKRFRFFEKYTNVLTFYNIRQLTGILIISSIRYFVYLLQYFLILKTYSINIGFVEGISGVSVVFLIQALLPSVTLTEIGTRGAAVLFVFERFGAAPVNLLLSAYTLWVINIIIPTLFGVFFILKIKTK